MQATARIFFIKAPAKKTADDRCPARLCVTHKRERRYYSLNKWIKDNDWLALPEDDIEKVMGQNPPGTFKDIRYEYDRIVAEARAAITALPVFSFNLFEQNFLDRAVTWDNIFTAMWQHIQDLKAEERFGYASSFESTLRAIKEFHTGKTFKFNPRKDKVEQRKEKYTSGRALNFIDITPAWLKRFRKWLETNGKSRSTIGIYERNIRVMFNVATKQHQVKAEYPFKTFKPKAPKSRKTALTAEQIALIANRKPDNHIEGYYRDLFVFSFLANGMNMSDIARLKHSNINEGELSFVREKTKLEEAEEESIRVPITESMKYIIDKYGRRAVGHDAYLFPILKPEWDERRKYAEIKQVTKQVNKYTRRIAKAAGINENTSSMTARHSWATISKNSGASTEFISEALGHSSVAVTKRYLKTFEKNTRKEHSDKIDNIINKKAQ